MAQLKPAGFLARLGTFFFPKHVIAQVRTETLDNGQVEITPFFTIDGEEVPADLVALDKRQSILGYNVVLDQRSENVLRQTQGKPTRLAKRRAGEFLSQLDKSGIAIRSKDGKIQPRVETVKPDVNLRLTPDDKLEVKSELCTRDGIVLDKPANLAQLRQEDGWFSVGDDLLRVDTSNTPLDDILIAEGGNQTLADDDVPKFLKSLDQQSKHVGEVEQNDALNSLSVFSGKPEYRARVDGTAESITISPSLVYRGTEGRQYEQTSEDVQRFEQHGGGFRRVTEGWVEVSAESIAAFQEACEELVSKVGPLEGIQGAAIPEALTSLFGATRPDGKWSNPWSVYYSEAVESAHRLIDTAADAEFHLNVVDSDGRSLLELDPIYNHDRFRIKHDEVQEADRNGEKWIRRRGAWVKVDRDKYKKIDAAAQVLKLQSGPSGFTFPASERERCYVPFCLTEISGKSPAFIVRPIPASSPPRPRPGA